jgi:hypothetical protein
MENSYFSLEVNRGSGPVRIFQLVFGVVCAAVAIAWLVVNIKTISTNLGLVITIIFLLGFAYYQINSGLGKGEKFIEISQNHIKLKKNSVLPVQVMKASDIEKIEVFPLKINFIIKPGKLLILRFGTTFIDTIDPIKQAIEDFSNLNQISHEIKKEEF